MPLSGLELRKVQQLQDGRLSLIYGIGQVGSSRHLTLPADILIFTHMVEYNSLRLDAVFGAVSDPTRRAILARLAISEARVTEIAKDFPVSLNSTSKHIKMLERAGLVRRTVRGRDHLLSLNAAPLSEAAGWIEHYRHFWEERLAALESFVIKKRVGSRKNNETKKKRSKTGRAPRD